MKKAGVIAASLGTAALLAIGAVAVTNAVINPQAPASDAATGGAPAAATAVNGAARMNPPAPAQTQRVSGASNEGGWGILTPLVGPRAEEPAAASSTRAAPAPTRARSDDDDDDDDDDD